MSRAAAVERRTAETGIRLALHLDGAGEADIHTGSGFFDHMLTLMPAHGMLALALVCDGDIEIHPCPLAPIISVSDTELAL